MASKTEAYIALVSLLNTLVQISDPPRHWIRLRQEQMQRLLDQVLFLIDYLEDEGNLVEIDGSETQMMTNTAFAAEDIVESYVLDLNFARSTGSAVEESSSADFALRVQEIIEEMDHNINRVIKIEETRKSLKNPPLNPALPAVSSRLAPNRQNTLVGLDHKVLDVMHMLDEPQPERQIVAVVGMGGIGKTTLARHVFDKPYIVYRFDIRAWVTVSQEYSVRKIILDLLSDIKDLGYQGKQRIDDFGAFSDDELGELLYKSLYDRTYLIVMDDMWCSEAWDELSAFFPDNCNRSRIMITTRLSSLGERLSSHGSFHPDFLDDGQSWELLCGTVFGQEVCPIELSNVGHTIAKNCRGLPLSLVVIGGFLANSSMTVEFWKYVAGNLNSIINTTDDENCLKILSLSYSNLPIYLKPCFMHMSFFPSWSVEKSWLIKLWVAEGILKPRRGKSTEEVGHEYLMDLIGRNLILVSNEGVFEEHMMCRIHDLLLDLCVQEARKENFLYELDISSLDYPPAGKVECKRRLFLNHISSQQHVRFTHQVTNALGRASQLRSMYFRNFGTTSLGSNLRFLRLLHQDYGGISSEIMKLVNLRLMFYSVSLLDSSDRFISSLSPFWNLQTLFLRNAKTEPILLPLEFWEMPQIRYVDCGSANLSYPPRSDVSKHDFCVLRNLHTLMGIVDFRCTKEVLERIPNVRKLWIHYNILLPGLEWSHFCLHNLAHFDKLESLSLEVHNEIYMENLGFPVSLNELRLNGGGIDWSNMTVVGSLPKLEVLTLYNSPFDGPLWWPIEGEFVRLKHLRVSAGGLIEWRADKTHFPILEYLVIGKMDHLEGIPLDFSEIPTLRAIKLENCNDSTIFSAKRILEELQENYGHNCCLKIIVECPRPRPDLYSLESHNFRVVIRS